ncbi:MAG: hypothetical protein ACOYIF_05075 [Acetivibrionales bacterium]|jgi:hypothetical protein
MDTMNVSQAMSQQIFQILTKASLENLSVGEIIKGRIQSLENGLLLIKLLDGSSFTAKAPDGFFANVGESIALEIGERQNNQLTAKIIDRSQIAVSKANEEADLIETIKSSLDSLGVESNQRLILSVLDLIKAEPGIQPEKASFLVANRLANDPEMSDILQKISEHGFSLHKNLNDLEEGLSEAIFKADADTALKLIKPLLISQETDELSGVLKDILPKSLFPEGSQKLAHIINKNVRELLTKILMDELSGQETGHKPNMINKEALVSLVKSALLSVETGSSSPENIKSDAILTPHNTEVLLKAINKALENILKITESLDRGDKTPELQKEIKNILGKLFEKAAIKFENGIVREFDIKEKTQALKDIMEFSQDALSRLDNNAKELNMPAFKEIDNALRFFNQVTTYDSILQLPIMINKENTTGELYVMKRKRGRKKIDADNFILFLSLTTNSLGVVESFLNASSKRITISFRVEDENLVKLVKDNYRILYDGLLEKGFKLVEMKCRVLEEDRVNPINAVNKAHELLGTQNRVDLKI